MSISLTGFQYWFFPRIIRIAWCERLSDIAYTKDVCQVTTLERVSHFRVDTHYGRAKLLLFFVELTKTSWIFCCSEWNIDIALIVCLFRYSFCNRNKAAIMHFKCDKRKKNADTDINIFYNWTLKWFIFIIVTGLGESTAKNSINWYETIAEY